MRPFPRPTPAGDGSPASPVLRAHYDCLPPVRPRFGSLRADVTCHSTVASLPCAAHGAAPRAGWLWSAGSTPSVRPFLGGDDRPSQVPGQPRCASALLSDPAGARCQAIAASSPGPGCSDDPAPRVFVRFRGSITRHRHSLSTLPRSGCPRRARLASGWWPASTGWDWLPTGLLQKVSPLIVQVIGFSFLQALPGATEHLTRRKPE